jgi:hypothetical protein
MRRALVLLLLLVTAGCATYREDLNRGQRLYEEHEYDRALAIWRYLEIDVDSLSYNDQARYAYLRGMTDYRLGEDFRKDARHWLAVAKAIQQEHPGGLNEQWMARLQEALADLNKDWWNMPPGEADAPASASAQPPAAQQPAAPQPAASAAQPPPAAQPAASAAQPAPAAPKKCTTHAECPDGQGCQGGQCVQM